MATAPQIELAWPQGGLSEDEAFEDQPVGTTGHAKNVRTNGASTQRDRGGQRAGSSPWSTGGGLDQKIADLLEVAFKNKINDYSLTRALNMVRERPAHDFTSAFWTNSNVTVTENSIQDTRFPSGNADLLEDSSAGAVGFLLHDYAASSTDAAIYCLSGYTKKDDSNQITLRLSELGGDERLCTLDPDAGTVVVSGSGTGSGDVESLGNGVYRFWVSFTYDGGPGVLRAEIQPDRAGSGTAGAYFDAIKVERIDAIDDGPSPYLDTGRGTEWQRDNPDGTDVEWCDTDRAGNHYHTYGKAGLRKLSHDGTAMWTHSFPTEGDAKVGTICLDESGNVYGAVSGSRDISAGEPQNGFFIGDIDDVRLWRYRQDYRLEEEGETQDTLIEEWVLGIGDGDEDLRGFVSAMVAQDGRLYTLQNDTRQWKAYLVVYGGIDGVFPVKLWERQVPYPANSISVAKNGRVAVSCQENTQRGFNPLSPQTRNGIVAWTPDNLDDDNSGQDKHKIASWYKIEDLAVDIRTDQGVDPTDGARVVWVRDRSGNNRHLVWDAEFGEPPLLRTKGLDGKPCLVFDGEACLVSLPNTTKNADFKDGQRTPIPLYQDENDAEQSGQYAFVGLWRPDSTASGSSLTNQMVMLDHGAATTGSAGAALIANREADDAAAAAGNHASQHISYFYRADAADLASGTSTGQQPHHGLIYQRDVGDVSGSGETWPEVTDPSQVALVSIVNCNGVDTGSGVDKCRTIFRLNGGTYDRYQAEADTAHSLNRVFIGKPDPSGPFATLGGLRGEFYELITFDRKTETATGNTSVIGHPTYPDNVTGDRVGSVLITAGGTGATNATNAMTFSGGGASTQAKGLWVSDSGGAVVATQMDLDGVGYTSAPTITWTGFSGAPDPTYTVQMYDSTATPTDLEKVEAYVMHRVGCGLILKDAYHYDVENEDGSLTQYIYPHPYRTTIPESSDWVGVNAFVGQSEVLALFDEGGKLLSTVNDTFNGIGKGCRFSLEGTFVYTAGDSSGINAAGTGVASDTASYRKIAIDDDGTLDPNDSTSWKALNTVDLQLANYVGIAVDSFDNLIAPCHTPGLTTVEASLFVLDGTDGTILEQVIYGDQVAGEGWGATWVALPKKLSDDARVVPDAPDYEDDLSTDRVEEVLIAGKASTYDSYDTASFPALEGTAPGALKLFKLVHSKPNGVQPRSFLRGAISGGGLYTSAENAAPVLVESDFLTPFGATGGYVHSVAAFEKGYYTDGVRYGKWDPKEGTAEKWTATKGKIPPRCRVAELWNGRLVLTADQEFRGAVHMSRQGEPDDWNTGAPTAYSTRAVSLGATEIGDVPDAVTGFIPYDSDRAVILADSSVWLLTGDPQAGGQLDLLTDITGGAFGRAWCKDPWGRIWFAGRRGGIWVMTGPRSVPVRASVDRIEKRLQGIDQSAYYIRMAYDWSQGGIVVGVFPYADPSATPEFYFVELVDDARVAFWPDEIAVSSKKMTAMVVIDGDTETDRRLLTGHSDGVIRYVDTAAKDDDGTPIDAYCRWGPYHTGDMGKEMMPKRANCVLANGLNGVDWSLFTSDQPDVPGTAYKTGTFTTGRNVNVPARGRGSYVWFQIGNSAADETFELEHLRIQVAVVGTVQRRS